MGSPTDRESARLAQAYVEALGLPVVYVTCRAGQSRFGWHPDGKPVPTFRNDAALARFAQSDAVAILVCEVAAELLTGQGIACRDGWWRTGAAGVAATLEQAARDTGAPLLTGADVEAEAAAVAARIEVAWRAMPAAEMRALNAAYRAYRLATTGTGKVLPYCRWVGEQKIGLARSAARHRSWREIGVALAG